MRFCDANRRDRFRFRRVSLSEAWKGITESMKQTTAKRTSRKTILAVDVGGTHVKVMTNKGRTRREFASGPHLSAKAMVKTIKALTTDWSYDVVSVGYPGPVVHDRPLAEPH